MDLAMSEAGLGLAGELGLISMGGKRTPPIPEVVRALSRYNSALTRLAPTLLAIHSLRNLAVHQVAENSRIDRERACELLEAVIEFVKTCGGSVALSVGVAAKKLSGIEVLLPATHPWGINVYGESHAKTMILGLEARKMVADWLDDGRRWPLLRCSLCASLAVPECLSTTQDDICFATCEPTDPVTTYCDAGCAKIHQDLLRNEDGRVDSWLVGEYMLQPLLELVSAGIRLPRHLYA
jgi:hypothetical protein